MKITPHFQIDVDNLHDLMIVNTFLVNLLI
jgi:hypothetical protein